jgi:type III pantothenate kinase
MILAIDCGNTRVKWGLRASHAAAWRASGAVSLGDIARLDVDWAALPAPERIVIANVAGDAARKALAGPLSRFSVEAQWLASQASQCGVTNGYADPAQLGVDRWAALIGAWHLARGACLVVNAGTATTADRLSSQGRFRGGIILPGVELMKQALAQNTAGLPLAQGRYVDDPACTADAIESGCLHAQAGAIERMYAGLETGAACLLSGGNAPRIARLLNIPVRSVDNLALEGLIRIGA